MEKEWNEATDRPGKGLEGIACLGFTLVYFTIGNMLMMEAINYNSKAGANTDSRILKRGRAR